MNRWLCAFLVAGIVGCLTAMPTAAASVMRFQIGRPTHPFPLRNDIPVTTNCSSIILGAETHNGTTVVRIALHEGEALWGFGERLDAWNQRGRIVENWARDMAQGGPHSSYFAVPFFVSSAGYGLFVNCSGKVRFDCGATQSDELRIEIPEAGADLFLFHGQPTEIVADYSKVVGSPARVPDWVFEPWLSRNSYLSAYEVDHVLDQMDAHGLKAGVVVLEAWAEGLQSFRFEPNRYPHAQQWIHQLRQRGYRVVLWETPSIWTSVSSYDIAKSNGWPVLTADGSEYVTDWLENGRLIDFRQPAARQWWTSLHQPLVALGVDGFKTDGGERYPDPWFHNLLPEYYQRAVLDAFPSNGVTFARSASAPCAGNSIFWAGDQHSDWNELPRVVRAGLSAAASGFRYWGHDIGGYAGTPTKRLYLRWLELGAFSPIMQLHGDTPREPWYYDDETVRIAKFYFDLRWALKPYLQNTTGPLWRPLAWEFPDDRTTWSLDGEFMLGPDLLVAPILNELTARNVYLPAGKWTDAWTGTVYQGPTNLSYRAALAVIPVFARNGRTLPAMPQFVPADVELDGPRNERGIVPTRRIWHGQKCEKILLTIKNADEVTLHAPAGFAVLPEAKQHGTRVAFGVMWPAQLDAGTYPVTVGPLTVQLMKLPAWPQPVREDGYVDLGKARETAATFNAHAGPARLWLGSGDGMTVWLNDAPVFSKQVYRNPEPDEDEVAVNLREGPNQLRVRLTHLPGGIGANGFYLRVGP